MRIQGCEDAGREGCWDTGIKGTEITDTRAAARAGGLFPAWCFGKSKSHRQLCHGDRDMSWPEQDPRGVKDCGPKRCLWRNPVWKGQRKCL